MSVARHRYPRTPHLPWSPGATSDDKTLSDCAHFEGQRVVVTEKMDGENTTIYSDGYTHARSADSRHHPSRSWMKALAAEVGPQLEPEMRICGENLFAFHSILYTDLPSYFFVFGIYRADVALPWDETKELCDLIGLQAAPLIYDGVWDEKTVQRSWRGEGAFPTFGATKPNPEYPSDFEPSPAEGYVVRLASSYRTEEFPSSCAKYVREHHVQSSTHWMHGKVIPNVLKA